MSSDGEERFAHLRAILITTAAALAGVAAAIGSTVVTGDAPAAEAAGDTAAQLVLLGAIVVQLPIYQFVFDEWGGAKDFLFVAFMTFALWFVTWGIILTTGARIV